MKKLIGLGAIGLLCWIVMFLAGTDVWHFAGRPDFWQLSGPPNVDLRAFATAFYLLFLVLLCVIALGVWNIVRATPPEK